MGTSAAPTSHSPLICLLLRALCRCHPWLQNHGHAHLPADLGPLPAPTCLPPGLATYGYKIMRVLGVKMTKLTNSRGACATVLGTCMHVICGQTSAH